MRSYLDVFLENRMFSSDGKELKNALEQTIGEEKQCLDLFKTQIGFCREQINAINKNISSSGLTQDFEIKKRAFEEHETILNVAAQNQQCSYEIKGIQKLLYFEKNENSRERIEVDASVMMYEWCDDLNELTGKKFQEIAQRLLSQIDLSNTRSARKKLKDFYDREKPILSKVRHNSGAHRDHDFMNQREILDNISWSDTIERLNKFEEVTLWLGKSITPLIEAGLKQIAKAFGE